MYDIIDLLQVPLPLQVSSSPARADEFAANIGQPAVRQIGYHLGTVPYKFYHLNTRRVSKWNLLRVIVHYDTEKKV